MLFKLLKNKVMQLFITAGVVVNFTLLVEPILVLNISVKRNLILNGKLLNKFTDTRPNASIGNIV